MEGERSVDSELWHACAGLRVSLPSIGSLVVYFPQGHSEQLAATTQKNMDGHIPNYPNLDSQLVCQLHNVALHADLETDEVFAQMTLHPLNKQEKDLFIAADDGTPNRQPTDFFCKILTASDTSTHGGFSIPRRAAEKVFPPLDFTKQPPTQELHAKDLHDHIWTFRHIFRGQPKRHLLTTGWSVFVSAKRLVAGDSVLFIRDEKGQLLLGIRRANRQQTVIPSSVLSSDSMHIGVLAAAAHAAATSSCFQVFYNPRTSPSEFVVPLAKYRKAMSSTQVSVGMRFRMVFETEDTTLRRYMGTITGIRDLDPDHWPGSKWRNLEVGWDESSGGERPRRVSIWEIEPVSTPYLMCPPFPLRPKRAQHTGLFGDGSEREESMKRCLTWLQGENGWRDLTSSTFQSLGRDTSQLQQQAQSAVKSDIYNVVGEATLQDFRHVDASKLLQQDPLQVQFKSLQQWGQHPLQQLEKQQRHAMWPQPNIHQHVFENNQQEHRPPRGLPQTQTPTGTGIQAQVQKPTPRPTPITIPIKPQMQAQPLTQVGTQIQSLPWSQSVSYSYSQSQSQSQLPQSLPQTTPITSSPVMLSTTHLQSCTSVQHPHPTHPPQSLPQSQSSSYSQSQSQSQSPSQLPQSLPQTTPTTAPPVMSHLQSRTSVQHLHPTHVPAHVPQLSFSQPQEYLNLPVIRPCTSVSKSESAFGTTSGVINSFSMQGSLGRFHSGTLTVDDNGHISSLTQPNQGVLGHAQEQQHQHQQLSIVWKQQQQAQEALPVLSSLAQLDNQSTGNWLPFTREINQCESAMPSNKQVGQSDASSTVTSCLFSIPPESLVVPSSFGNLNKEVQCHENTSGSFLSPSGKFLSAAADVDAMPGAMANGGLDEALLQRNCSWPQMSTHFRTYTKVYKAGSIGRSIDLSRLKCYEELRRELACMFNLEGQLEDPQRSCWQLVFVDNDGDILLIGDDPWDEFVSCVRAIKILSAAQVVQLNEEGLVQLASLPIPQQTRSSSENCHVWKDQ